MADLTWKQQKILIDYCEKIKYAGNADKFKKDHETFLSISSFKFLGDRIPPFKDDWNKYLQEINNIQQKEIKAYRKKRRIGAEPEYKNIEADGQKRHRTPHEFIKMAKNCKTVEEYGQFYKANYEFKNVIIREFTPNHTGLYNEGSDVPIMYVTTTPENLARLYKFADEALCDYGRIPSPDIIKNMGLSNIEKIERLIERDKQEEFHQIKMKEEKEEAVNKTDKKTEVKKSEIRKEEEDKKESIIEDGKSNEKVELTQDEKNIFIDYCEKISNVSDLVRLDLIHDKFLSVKGGEKFNELQKKINDMVFGFYGDEEHIKYTWLIQGNDTPENLERVRQFGAVCLKHINSEVPDSVENLREMMEKGKNSDIYRQVVENVKIKNNTQEVTPEAIKRYEKSADEGKNEIGKETEEKNETAGEVEKLKNFAVGAFMAGTRVPPFVMVKDDKCVNYSGYFFKEEKEGGIILSKNENGVLKEIKLDSAFYKHIVENAKITANTPAVTPEVIKKQELSAEADRVKLRENTASNFWHNYRVMCRENATNQSDAMKIANEIVSKMPLYEQLHFKREAKEYNRLTGSKDSYNKRLINYYDENVKDLPVTHSIFSKESKQLVSDEYYDVVKKSGESIDKNSTLKIGGMIKMSFDFKDIASGKNMRLPPKELIIVAASAEKNKVVLVDKDNLSKYTIPRNEFLQRTQKYEKVLEKEKKREAKREMRSALAYSY